MTETFLCWKEKAKNKSETFVFKSFSIDLYDLPQIPVSEFWTSLGRGVEVEGFKTLP